MTYITFPYRLYNVLEEISKNDKESSIFSWSPTGRTFRVHDPDAFHMILQKYFPKQNKYNSFRRQLQYYGFYTIGRNHFGHRLFVRNQPELLPHIKHRKVQSSTTSSKPLVAHDLAHVVLMLESTPLKPLPWRSEEDVVPRRNSLRLSPTSSKLDGDMAALLRLNQATVPALSPQDSKISSHLRAIQTKAAATVGFKPPAPFVDHAREKAMKIKRKLDLDILLLTLQRQRVAKEYASNIILQQRAKSAFIDLARIQLGL